MEGNSGSVYIRNTIEGISSSGYKQHLSSPSIAPSQTSSMVNVFGESVGSGSVDLQLVKNVVTTVGQYKDYWAEINQSYVLSTLPTAYKCR